MNISTWGAFLNEAILFLFCQQMWFFKQEVIPTETEVIAMTEEGSKLLICKWGLMESTYIRVIKHPGREGRVFFMTGHHLSIILHQINLNAEGEPHLS